MSDDKMREETLEKIAAKWREAAALGCVDALECALREAWQASREAVVVELPSKISQHNTRPNGYVMPEAENYDEAIDDCRAAIEASGIRTSLTR